MKDFKGLSPLDYFKILWLRRWYMLGTFLLLSIAAGTYAWLTPNTFRSESRVMVEAASIPQDYVRPSVRTTPEEQIGAIRGAVQSRSFLERMIQELALYGYGTGQDFSIEEAVKAISRNVEVANTSRETFTIAFRAADPQTAQNITKRMVETLISSRVSSRKTKAIDTDQFLEDQLGKTQQSLAAQEEKIKQFKMAHLGELPEQSDVNLNALSRLDIQFANIENVLQQLRERQRLLNAFAKDQKKILMLAQDLIVPEPKTSSMQDRSGSPSGSLLAAKQAELSALLTKYTPQYPDVVRLSREIEQLKRQMAQENGSAQSGDPSNLTPLETRTPEQQTDSNALVRSAPDTEVAEMKIEAEAIKNEIARREKEKEAVQSQMRRFQGRLNLAPAIEQELLGLSREHESLKQQYDTLQGKKLQSQMTASMESNTAGDTYKVIDEANLPEKPIFPTRIQIVLMGLLAGIVMGIGAAFARELLDTTINREEDAVAVLKLPVLASISEMPRKEPKRLIGLNRMNKSA